MYPVRGAVTWKSTAGTNVASDALSNLASGGVTGGAGGELRQAAAAGVDTFITGEGPHWTFALAEELVVNVLYAGHYATETFGVKALAEHLSQKFSAPWVFIDHPTGM